MELYHRAKDGALAEVLFQMLQGRSAYDSLKDWCGEAGNLSPPLRGLWGGHFPKATFLKKL